jgi:hypothetical protein
MLARFAMNPKMLASIGRFLKPGFADAAGEVTKASIAGRIAPDLLFGGMAAMQTPGDAFDKGAAFLGSSLGGIAGGAGATAATHKLGLNLGGMQEFIGGIGGDMIGMAASDAVTRGKDLAMGGRGETGWERMGSAQQEQMRKEMEQSILAQYGMAVPGGRYDEYLRDLGMA